MPALSNRERQAARLARYRAMKFALEHIRRECPDPATRRLADEALAGAAPAARTGPRVEDERAA
jgi:hypothetical protein